MSNDFVVGASEEIARLSLGQGQRPNRTDPPSVSIPGSVVTVDITNKFIQAAKSLAPGDLVKDELFTLFESVGALEIMDPKMDSGYLKPGDDFEETYDVSKPLLPEEVLGIIDQLLCFEMSWHLGYPLSQTLLSSVYVEALSMPDPANVEDAKFVRSGNVEQNAQPMLQVLRAYCLGMLKACGYVNQQIRFEHYYEEEDFVTNTYNRSLLSSIATQGIRNAIVEAQDLLENLRGTIDDGVIEALDVRLQLRSTLLSAAECPQHIRDPDAARRPWKEGLLLLSRIEASHKLGKPVEEAFSAKLQRKLASTIPPRPIVHIKFEEAFEHLTRLFRDGLEVIDVLDWTDSQCLQTFVSMFQSKQPQPLVFVRTLLQTFMFSDMQILGKMSIRQLIDDDLSIITLPASPYLDRANDEIEVTTDPRFALAQQMELFRQRAAQPFLDTLRTICQNRCRTRRTLTHAVRDWESLQLDAEEIDEILQQKMREHRAGAHSGVNLALSSWTFLYKLKQMEFIIQLGFELETYQVDELNGMYWYLNYVSKSRLHHAERIKTIVFRQVDGYRKAKGSGNAGEEAEDATEKQLQRSLAYTRLLLLDAAVTWEFSDALSCLYTVLSRLGLVRPPPRPFSDDRLRYEIRMKPFAPIGLPELPSFEEFIAGTTQPENSSVEILLYAERALAGVKKGLEMMSRMTPEDSFSVGSHERWTASAKKALKASIMATLAVSTLKKAMHKDGEDVKLKAEVPTPEKGLIYHEWWIVPKLIPTTE